MKFNEFFLPKQPVALCVFSALLVCCSVSIQSISNPNMNRSLDELNASELNAAIDDTNFPKAQSTMCLSRTSDDTRSPTNVSHQNGNSIAPVTTPPTDTALHGNGNTDEAKDDQNNENGVQNGHKGFIKRVHPAPLKMVAFKGDSIDIPGTPRTPRTSTTPGETKSVIYIT